MPSIPVSCFHASAVREAPCGKSANFVCLPLSESSNRNGNNRMRFAATMIFLGVASGPALADTKALYCDTIVEVAARDGSRAEAEMSRVLDQTFRKARVCSQDGGWAQGRYYAVSTIDHGGKDTKVCFDLTPASKRIAQAQGRAVTAEVDSGIRP